MDYSIEFYYDRNLDPVFIHKLFYFLVSKGVRYNNRYTGQYFIFPAGLEKNIEYTERMANDSTEKLAEIIDTYLKYDIKSTHFSIFLTYFGSSIFNFYISFAPDSDKCLVSFDTNDAAIPDSKTFLSFVNLCKEAFTKFNFVYGSFRNRYQDSIPLEEWSFLEEKPNIVNFYSRPLVDKIGRERLLSTPAFKVEELENGGVMLIVCTEPLGCDNIYEVWRHLGYKSL